MIPRASSSAPTLECRHLHTLISLTWPKHCRQTIRVMTHLRCTLHVLQQTALARCHAVHCRLARSHKRQVVTRPRCTARPRGELQELLLALMRTCCSSRPRALIRSFPPRRFRQSPSMPRRPHLQHWYGSEIQQHIQGNNNNINIINSSSTLSVQVH